MLENPILSIDYDPIIYSKMDVNKLIIESDFSCTECGQKTPQIALFEKSGKAVCNICAPEQFLKAYCKDTDDKELCLLEITEAQIKLMIAEIRKNVKGKVNEIEQINSYWEVKTDNKFSLAEGGKNTIEKFLHEFTLEEIQQSIDIAFNKVSIDEDWILRFE